MIMWWGMGEYGMMISFTANGVYGSKAGLYRKDEWSFCGACNTDGKRKGTAKMISVIIPTYNRARLLPRALQSVLNQTFSEIEVIVVDDASTDNTEQIVASMTDSRIWYVRLDHNSGACIARNIGIQAAHGKWIAFQDSDDEWLPDKLEKQFAQLQETGADVVFCAFKHYGTDGEKQYTFPHAHVQPGRITYEQLLFENLVSTQTILGKRECFEQTPFKPNFPRLQDWEMMLRMVQRYDVRYFNDVLVRLYEQPDSISRQPELALAALEELRYMHGNAIGSSNRLTLQMCHSISAARQRCGLPAWPPYFRELSIRRNPAFNMRLLLTGVKRMLLH